VSPPKISTFRSPRSSRLSFFSPSPLSPPHLSPPDTSRRAAARRGREHGGRQPARARVRREAAGASASVGGAARGGRGRAPAAGRGARSTAGDAEGGGRAAVRRRGGCQIQRQRCQIRSLSPLSCPLSPHARSGDGGALGSGRCSGLRRQSTAARRGGDSKESFADNFLSPSVFLARLIPAVTPILARRLSKAAQCLDT